MAPFWMQLGYWVVETAYIQITIPMNQLQNSKSFKSRIRIKIEMKGIQIKINSTILYGTSYRTKHTA